MMIPWLPYAKIIICSTFDCARRHFFGRGDDGPFHSLDCDFNSGSKSLTHVSSNTTIRFNNVSILMYARCSSIVTVPETRTGSISKSRNLKMEYTTNETTASSSFELQ